MRELKLEVGKYYLTCDGRKAGPLGKSHGTLKHNGNRLTYEAVIDKDNKGFSRDYDQDGAHIIHTAKKEVKSK